MSKILLIDDEAELNEYIRSYLGKRGIRTVCCLTGTYALDIYQKEDADIILLDLRLPDMDGREILKQIKTNSSKCKVIVASANNDVDTKKEVLELGADYFLGKPFTIPDLYALIKQITEQNLPDGW